MLWTVCGISCHSLEHREGPFHIPCLSARKVLYANRSSVCNKLGVWPPGICIPSHPGREANPHSNSSSWGRRWMATIPLVGMNHFRRTWNTTGVNGETYSPSWKKYWFLVATMLKDLTLSHGGRYMHFPVQARKPSEPYLCEFNKDGVVSLSLLFRWSKMAPSHMMSIPRLVLCSEIPVTQGKMMNRTELDIEIDEEIYYSDSKVVLGYIQNESRRFYVHNAAAPSQGRYINTARNPADLATRYVTPQLETDRIAMDTGTLISMESAATASSFTPGGTPQRKKPWGEKGSHHLCQINTLTPKS